MVDFCGDNLEERESRFLKAFEFTKGYYTYLYGIGSGKGCGKVWTYC